MSDSEPLTKPDAVALDMPHADLIDVSEATSSRNPVTSPTRKQGGRSPLSPSRRTPGSRGGSPMPLRDSQGESIGGSVGSLRRGKQTSLSLRSGASSQRSDGTSKKDSKGAVTGTREMLTRSKVSKSRDVIDELAGGIGDRMLNKEGSGIPTARDSDDSDQDMDVFEEAAQMDKKHRVQFAAMDETAAEKQFMKMNQKMKRSEELGVVAADLNTESPTMMRKTGGAIDVPVPKTGSDPESSPGTGRAGKMGTQTDSRGTPMAQNSSMGTRRASVGDTDGPRMLTEADEMEAKAQRNRPLSMGNSRRRRDMDDAALAVESEQMSYINGDAMEELRTARQYRSYEEMNREASPGYYFEQKRKETDNIEEGSVELEYFPEADDAEVPSIVGSDLGLHGTLRRRSLRSKSKRSAKRVRAALAPVPFAEWDPWTQRWLRWTLYTLPLFWVPFAIWEWHFDNKQDGLRWVSWSMALLHFMFAANLASAFVAHIIFAFRIGATRLLIHFWRFLRPYTGYLLWSVVMLVLTPTLFQVNQQGDAGFIIPLLTSLVVTFAVFMGKGVLLAIAAMQFKRTRFYLRTLYESRRSYLILNQLSIPRHKMPPLSEYDDPHKGSDENALFNDVFLQGYQHFDPRLKLPRTLTWLDQLKFEDIIREDWLTERVMTTDQLIQSGKKLAKSIFNNLRNAKAEEIVIDDLLRHIHPDSCREAFGIFDLDKSGGVTYREMRDIVISMKREKRSYNKSLETSEIVIGQMSAFMDSIAVFILIWCWLFIFGVNINEVLVSISAIIVAYAFIFGNTLRRYFESAVFLFFVHPFDVEDRVVIRDTHYFVRNIDFLSTTLRKPNGEIVIASNADLNDLMISNLRRSPDMAESFDLWISAGTPTWKIHALKNAISRYLKAKSTDWYPDNLFTVQDLAHRDNLLAINVWVEGKDNWQEYGRAQLRRTGLFLFMKQVMEDLKVSYMPPMQPIGFDSHYPLVSADGSSPMRSPSRASRRHSRNPSMDTSYLQTNSGSQLARSNSTGDGRMPDTNRRSNATRSGPFGSG
eukprot:Clim_evm1s115 gene=Clim_evmTU1s115